MKFGKKALAVSTVSDPTEGAVMTAKEREQGFSLHNVIQ